MLCCVVYMKGEGGHSRLVWHASMGGGGLPSVSCCALGPSVILPFQACCQACTCVPDGGALTPALSENGGASAAAHWCTWNRKDRPGVGHCTRAGHQGDARAHAWESHYPGERACMHACTSSVLSLQACAAKAVGMLLPVIAPSINSIRIPLLPGINRCEYAELKCSCENPCTLRAHRLQKCVCLRSGEEEQTKLRGTGPKGQRLPPCIRNH